MSIVERLPEGTARMTEVGAWSLSYLGPGFHVQLRIASGPRGARLDGFMSPTHPMRVQLIALGRPSTVLETVVSDSGRFEFQAATSGPHRLSFIGGDQPFMTPPIWI